MSAAPMVKLPASRPGADMLASWAEGLGQSRARVRGHGCLRFAFYGRVSTEGAQVGTDLFSSTAAALVRGGFTAAAAMQYEISDQAAIAFARGFYTALALGRGIDQAVQSGRVAILGSGDHTLEWLTPVLYLRGRETRLFSIP